MEGKWCYREIHWLTEEKHYTVSGSCRQCKILGDRARRKRYREARERGKEVVLGQAWEPQYCQNGEHWLTEKGPCHKCKLERNARYRENRGKKERGEIPNEPIGPPNPRTNLPPKKIGEALVPHLKDVRLELGVSPEEFAEQVGISTSHLAQLEDLRARASIELQRKLTSAVWLMKKKQRSGSLAGRVS